MTGRFQTFAEFWPYYLGEHARPLTRRLHYLGTSLGILLFVLALSLAEPWLLLAALIAGYGFAWFAHFAVERNRPATFTYPLWSFAGDFKMLWLWLTRRLDPELEAAGVKKR
ncbi:MAG: DUF962 domain-containing protein [Alphaproteobacteria bacterium]|nr:DUF962 domain-containing protein [Alphaproteobacteria bacterium]